MTIPCPHCGRRAGWKRWVCTLSFKVIRKSFGGAMWFPREFPWWTGIDTDPLDWKIPNALGLQTYRRGLSHWIFVCRHCGEAVS